MIEVGLEPLDGFFKIHIHRNLDTLIVKSWIGLNGYSHSQKYMWTYIFHYDSHNDLLLAMQMMPLGKLYCCHKLITMGQKL